MHIEQGVVDGAKLLLSYGTAAAAGLYTAKLALDGLRDGGAGPLALRAAAATALTVAFFEVLPTAPVGVSEVHLILGATLLLLFGAAPTAIGLAAGLLIQGLLFAPFDLPQFGMNVTTLLAPLFAVQALANRIIPANTAYVDLSYPQVLKLSAAYQGGVIAWVVFWALYGQGFGADNLAGVATFGLAYLVVIAIEPVVDLAVLAGAKALGGRSGGRFVTPRLHHAA